MRPLIITPEVEEQFKALVEYAEANPVSVDDLLDMKNKYIPPIGDNEKHVLNLSTGYRIVYSIENQPKGDVRHLSVSVNTQGKMASVSASLATAKFNQLRPNKIALFDSRVFTIPTAIEVENYLIWRQQDTTRNSISSVAQWLYSPKELHGKDTDEMQEMCFQKGVNWNDYDPKLKRGRLIVKEQYDKNGAMRTKWTSTAPPIFTQEREILTRLIPNNTIV